MLNKRISVQLLFFLKKEENKMCRGLFLEEKNHHLDLDRIQNRQISYGG